jgi:hypothetical protein
MTELAGINRRLTDHTLPTGVTMNHVECSEENNMSAEYQTRFSREYRVGSILEKLSGKDI